MIQDCYVEAYYGLLGKSLFLKPLRFIVRVLANMHLKIAFAFNNKRYSCTGNKEDVIVSLTSFPGRIKNLWLGVETLLRQSVPPQRIYVWLSKEQFKDFSKIPHSLKRLRERGVEIRLVTGDIRSHKKYFYVFKEHPYSLILFADDDIIYPSDLLQSLLSARIGSGKDKVIVHKYGYRMRYTEKGELEPYNKWGSFYCAYEGDDLFFGSGGGTLVCPKDFWKDVLNIELALRLCPSADDVWLNAMAKLNLCSFVKVKDGPILSIHNGQAPNLSAINMAKHENDQQIHNIRQYYVEAIGIDPFACEINHKVL